MLESKERFQEINKEKRKNEEEEEEFPRESREMSGIGGRRGEAPVEVCPEMAVVLEPTGGVDHEEAAVPQLGSERGVVGGGAGGEDALLVEVQPSPALDVGAQRQEQGSRGASRRGAAYETHEEGAHGADEGVGLLEDVGGDHSRVHSGGAEAAGGVAAV